MMIVEDGTHVTDANSYVAITYADTYNAQYNASSDWAYKSNTEKENALIQATRSVDVLYGPRFDSMVLSPTQDMLWPRHSFYDRQMRLHNAGTIPKDLKDAVCEIALMAIAESDILPNESQVNIVSDEQVTVGQISIKTAFKSKGTNPQYDNFGKVEQLLADLFADRKVTRFVR